MAYEEIEKAARAYVESWYHADADTMAGAVHPDLANRGAVIDETDGKEQIRHKSAEDMVKAIKLGRCIPKPEELPEIEIAVFDVFQNIASVRINSSKYVDFLHLVKIGNEWKVINALWTYCN